MSDARTALNSRIDTPDRAERSYDLYVDGKLIKITIGVDLYSIAKELAHKAARNKSQRTKLCRGAVVVKAVKA